MCHMGRHGDGYDGTILPSCDISLSDVGCSSKRKTAKYAPSTQAYSFMAIAAETMGAMNSDSIEFLDDPGRRITQVTDDNLEN